ncbi:hypothetical protein CS542_06300 [Pedobacter sp. IW39]|nr:hypothetical protein CS542_06300 [Pedobacter sp. IW39]
MAQNPYTPEMVLAFMQRLLPKLEALDFVQRYSWFQVHNGVQFFCSRLWSSALVDATTTIKWYSAYKPNTAIRK